MIAEGWNDYRVLATGGGEKLENWGGVLLLRPDPQVIWPAQSDLKRCPGLNAHYLRSSDGGGRWEVLRKFPDEWTVEWRNLKFLIRPMGFKHTGLFPEQAANWAQTSALIAGAKREIRVLNLFAYTGGATVACAKAGAFVTHVDAAKNMVDRAKRNCELSGVPGDRVRYIVDDCEKFVRRELNRGKTYDAIVMDPPSYGRGPGGELWKIEDNLFDLVRLSSRLLSDRPLFYLINGYTTGLQAGVMDTLLALTFGAAGSHRGYEVLLPTDEGITLPCGNSALWKSGDT